MEAGVISEDDMGLKRPVSGGRLRAANLEEANYGTIVRLVEWNVRATHADVVYLNTSNAHASTNKTTNN